MRCRLKEVWKVSVTHKSQKYEVSNFGRVRFSVDKSVITLTASHGRREYLSVGHCYVHHMVLCTFRCPKPFPEAQCRHLDGNPFNNRLTNLKWGTPKENSEDRRRHGRSVISEETRARISAARMGNTNSKGKKHSDEHRRKISLSLMGNKRCVGRFPTEEQRAVLSAAHKKTWAWKKSGWAYV